jgi:hypothetical protein
MVVDTRTFPAADVGYPANTKTEPGIYAKVETKKGSPDFHEPETIPRHPGIRLSTATDVRPCGSSSAFATHAFPKDLIPM